MNPLIIITTDDRLSRMGYGTIESADLIILLRDDNSALVYKDRSGSQDKISNSEVLNRVSECISYFNL